MSGTGFCVPSACVGCFTLVCLIIGSGINRVIAGDPELSALCYGDFGAVGSLLMNGSNVTPVVANDGLTPCEHVKVQLAITIAFMSGLIMVCVRACMRACVLKWYQKSFGSVHACILAHMYAYLHTCMHPLTHT